ncbi:hypothetical protein [Halorarius halobius]|uniref:hypothetical protein n=1 Tax=Halorarius halobius TaxID=2962671 RepID=UPI0020CC017C|nr:hypothetical protein [Halorarius halobius]
MGENNRPASEHGESSDGRQTGGTRRDMLKTVAATGLAGVGLTGASGSVVASDPWTGTTVAAYRDRSRALSEADVRDLQDRALEAYRAATGAEAPRVVGTPDAWSDEVETDVEVVSYALKLYPDGTSEYHAGIVEKGKPAANVSRAHDATRSTAAALKDADAATATSSGVSTQSDDANYEYVAGGTTTNPGCPEGTLSVSSEVYEFVAEGSSRTLFSTQADFQAIPGNKDPDCNGAWYNGYTDQAAHQWDKSELSGAQQVDHEPQGAKSGTQSATFSLSTQGAEISWSYDQPNVERDDNSTLDQANWYYDYNSQDAAGATCVWETGSEAEFDRYQDPDYGDKINKGYFKHRFFDKLNYGREMKDLAYDYRYGYK